MLALHFRAVRCWIPSKIETSEEICDMGYRNDNGSITLQQIYQNIYGAIRGHQFYELYEFYES